MSITDDILISQSEFAKRWNDLYPNDTITRQYVSKLVNIGEFPNENKKIPYASCKKKLEEKKNNPEREAQREANRLKKQGNIGLFNETNVPSESLADMSEEEIEDFYKAKEEIKNLSSDIDSSLKDNAIENMSFNDIKKFKEYFQGLKAKLDYERESELLILKEEVERNAYEISRITRNKLLSIPSRVSSILASMNDKREVQGYLYEEIYNALSELSREINNEY